MAIFRDAFLYIYPPLSLILFIPTLIYRWAIFHLSSLPSFKRLFCPRLGKMLNAFATPHALVTEHSSFIIPICINGLVRKETILEKVREVMEKKDTEGRLLYPELRQTVVSLLGFLFWEDVEEFSLEDRIVQLDSIVGVEESITNFNSRVFKIGYEPLWEVGLIHKPEENETLALFQLHHALCDGLSFANFLDNMTYPKFQKDWDKILKQDGTSESILRCCSLIRAPLDISLFLVSIFRSGMFKEQERVPTGQLCYKTSEIDVKKVKEVSHACKVSFTSVAVAMYTSGLRKVAEHRMENPGHKMLHIPIPWPGRKEEQLRNWGSFIHVILPLDEVSPLKRLQKINNQLTSMKGSSLPLLSFAANRVAGLSLPALLKKVMSIAMKNGSGHIFTPFLVSREKVNLFDNEMKAMKGGCIPMEGTRGTQCTWLGYGDKAYIAMNADEGILSPKEAEIFLQAWNEELNVLNLLKGVHIETV